MEHSFDSSNSYIIFPEKTWLNSPLGLAEIKDIAENLQKSQISFKAVREFMAVVLVIKNFDDMTAKILFKKIPKNSEIPAIITGKTAIISNSEVILCKFEEEKFQKLWKDAQGSFSEIGIEKEKKPKISISEINRICREFTDAKNMSFVTELDIEGIYENLKAFVEETLRHKLVGFLKDIKCVWVALNYDFSQIGKYSDDSSTSRFERYFYVNNGIVRIQILWEKLIGLAVLLESPQELDKVISKGRGKFTKDFEKAENPITKAIWNYCHYLDFFGNDYRTPELHKIGRSANWTMGMDFGDELNRLIGYRNDLNILFNSTFK